MDLGFSFNNTKAQLTKSFSPSSSLVSCRARVLRLVLLALNLVELGKWITHYAKHALQEPKAAKHLAMFFF